MTPDLDRYADLDSPIHRWDARWKIAGLAILLVSFAIERPSSRTEATWLEDLLPASVGLALSVIVLVLSRLPWRHVARRLMVPAVFLLFLLVLFPLMHSERDVEIGPIAMSSTGFQLALLISLRALSMLLLVFPMLSTSRFHRTMKALRALKVPTPLVQILFFTYRYLFVFVEQLARIRRAMRSRGLVARVSPRTVRALGNGLGVALVSSVERTQRVHAAMRARGYSGEVPVRGDFRTRPSDITLFALCSLVATGMIVWRFV